MENQFGGETASEILLFQVNRGITNTYKEALRILEELQREHEEALLRLRNSLKEEDRKLVDVADYWHSGKYKFLRQRLLSCGNDGFRNIQQQADSLKIEFK